MYLKQHLSRGGPTFATGADTPNTSASLLKGAFASRPTRAF